MRSIAVFVVSMATAVAAHGQTHEQIAPDFKSLLARPDVARLPFTARDQYLLKLNDPEYGKLPVNSAFEIIFKAEAEQSRLKGLAPLRLFPWYQGCRGCGHLYVRGKRHLTAEYGPITVSVSLGRFEKFVGAHVYAALRPQVDFGVDLLPTNVRLVTLQPHVLECKPAQLKKVAKAVRHGAGWKAALVEGFGNAATRTATVTEQGSLSGSSYGSDGFGTFSGSYSGSATVTVPDEVARERARQRAQQVRASADARSQGVIGTALTGTTIMPGEQAGGFVYFQRDKKQEQAVLQVIVGAVSFEFPLRW